MHQLPSPDNNNDNNKNNYNNGIFIYIYKHVYWWCTCVLSAARETVVGEPSNGIDVIVRRWRRRAMMECARVRGDDDDDDDQFRSQEAERESDAATLTHIDGRPFVLFRRARPSPRTFNSATVAAVFLSHVHDSPPSVF